MTERKKPGARLPQGPPPGGEVAIVRKKKGKQKSAEEGNTWGRNKSEVVRRARASIISEMELRGVNKNEIGKHFGISRARVSQISKWAEENGLVEEIRERVRQELLPKAADVYRMLFDLPAAHLADKSVQKGYELKLKAAKHVAEGVGAFRKQSENKSKVTQTLDLEEFMTKRRANLEDAARAIEFEQLSRGTLNSSGDGGDGGDGNGEVLDVELISSGKES